MGKPDLENSKSYRKVIRLRVLSTACVGGALIVAYLLPVLQLTAMQSKLALLVVLPVVACLSLGYLFLESRWSAPVVQVLDANPAEVSEGLYRAPSLPSCPRPLGTSWYRSLSGWSEGRLRP